MPFYAIAIGKEQKVTESWLECQQLTKGYSGAKFKKVNSVEEGHKYIEEIALTYQNRLLNEFELEQKLIPSFTNKIISSKTAKTELYIGSNKTVVTPNRTCPVMKEKVDGITKTSLTVSCLIATRYRIKLEEDKTPILRSGDSRLNHYYTSTTEPDPLLMDRQLMYLELLIENLKILRKEDISVIQIHTDSNYLLMLFKEDILKSMLALTSEVRYGKTIKEMYHLAYQFEGIYISYCNGKYIPDKLKYIQARANQMNSVVLSEES